MKNKKKNSSGKKYISRHKKNCQAQREHGKKGMSDGAKIFCAICIVIAIGGRVITVAKKTFDGNDPYAESIEDIDMERLVQESDLFTRHLEMSQSHTEKLLQ